MKMTSPTIIKGIILATRTTKGPPINNLKLFQGVE